MLYILSLNVEHHRLHLGAGRVTPVRQAKWNISSSRGKQLVCDPTSSSINTHDICVVWVCVSIQFSRLIIVINCIHSVKGRIVYVPIYKKDSQFGFLTEENHSTIDSMIADVIKKGFTLKDNTHVKLMESLLVDK